MTLADDSQVGQGGKMGWVENEWIQNGRPLSIAGTDIMKGNTPSWADIMRGYPILTNKKS